MPKPPSKSPPSKSLPPESPPYQPPPSGPQATYEGRRICLLTDQDLDQDPFPEDDWPCDPRPFIPEATWDLEVLEKDSCVSAVVQAARRGYDLFFNLCDGAWDEGRVGIEVVQTLEALEVPFTGADSHFFEPSREAMKRVCRAWGIDTPAYSIARSDEDVAEAAEALCFPLIVKHPSGYASSGLTKASRVTTPAALAEQAHIMMETYGAALIEEFVEGNEYTVLVAENADDPRKPIVYPPLQFGFPEGESFKHYDLKWVDYAGLTCSPVADPEIESRLREASSLFFLGIGGVGYGRCDLRGSPEGRVFMLEINPNCGIYYPPTDPASADQILLNHPAGHEGFTRAVVAAALARHGRRYRTWEVRSRPGGDYGLFARRAIGQGQRIIELEGQPHHLVTRSHVERHWDDRQLDWFSRHAWPLTDEVWVIWSDDPESWRPLNHSCDPNAWLEGLDVVARRPIERGEEITLDYNTYADERMPSFECACGSEDCRGTIRGGDYARDFMARYEGHMSDHVARKRGGE